MLEAILVSVTFLMIIPFLLYPVLIKTDWDYIKMNVNGQDLLSTLDRMPDGESFLQNIMDKNETDLEEIIDGNFNWLKKMRVNYGIQSLGAVKKEIRVGFNCTPGDGSCLNDNLDDETLLIESLLRPAYLNGRYIYFNVFPFSYENISRYKMDVLLVRGDKQRDEADSRVNSEIKYALDSGTGVVGFYNVSAVGPLEADVFGLVPSGAGGGNLYFTNYGNPLDSSYDIQKYFYPVGLNENFTYKWVENEETEIVLWGESYDVRRNNTDCPGSDYCRLDFDNDSIPGHEFPGKQEGDWFTIEHNGDIYNFTVEDIDPRGRFFIVDFERNVPYEFEAFADDSASVTSYRQENVVLNNSFGRAGLVVNGTGDSRWRAVWLAGGGGNDVKALLKSSIIWASERSWWNIMRSVSREHTKISYFVSQGEDFHEPYWVEFSLWYIY